MAEGFSGDVWVVDYVQWEKPDNLVEKRRKLTFKDGLLIEATPSDRLLARNVEDLRGDPA